MNCVVYTVNQVNLDRQPAIEAKTQPKLNGVLYVNTSPGNYKTEIVNIVVSLRKLSKIKPIQDWSKVVQKKQPTTLESREFSVNKSVWLNGKGINWVIPTQLFGETNIQIDIDTSALLATGFIVEVFRRDCTLIHEVPANAKLTIGCTIEFNIAWNLSTNPIHSTPVVTPSRWSALFTEAEQARLSESQLSILGITSEEDN